MWGCANDFTVCQRSGSPSSVIRLAGDRRMPPSPRGRRKGTNPQRPCRGRRPDAPAAAAMACFCLRQIRTHPVGNTVPGVPRSSTQPKQSVGRIRTHPVGRADPGAPRSNTPVFHNFGQNRKRLPGGKGLAPSGRECPDTRQPWANSQPYSAFARGFPVLGRVLRGKGKPFPYNGTVADSPDVGSCLPCCCWRAGSARPTRKCCGFAGHGGLSRVLLPGRRGRRPLQGNAANSP